MFDETFDFDAARAEFAQSGVLSIPGFLDEKESAELLASLTQRDDWLEVFHANGSTYEMKVEDYLAMDPTEREALERMVWREASSGFQFRFRTVRVPDAIEQRAPSTDPLHLFAARLCATEMLDRFRHITQCSALNFADAQATAYSAGHFLNQHDDAVEGKGRVAAYVYGLTREWAPDWGGHLIFPEGERISGLMPQFNTLRLFAVPRPHSVTFVPPFVSYSRYSITGWLRVIDDHSGS